MTAARQLSRAEVLALPPVISLADLAAALGVSEPTVRQARRSGELERLGIKVTRLGAQHRVITATLWEYLGLTGSASIVPAASRGASQSKPSAPALRPARGSGAA